jgi:hypothetical protein
MSTLAVTNLKHESATGNNIVLASDGTATFAEVISASKGIAFPATQVSSANANTLDDYEEGSWTGSATASGGGTLTVSNEVYTKIGNVVNIGCTVNFTSASANMNLSGLPFTIASGPSAVGVGREDASNGYMVYIRANPSGTTGSVYYAGATGNASPFQTATGTFQISLTYFA